MLLTFSEKVYLSAKEQIKFRRSKFPQTYALIKSIEGAT
jgi:hypothetical protein